VIAFVRELPDGTVVGAEDPSIQGKVLIQVRRNGRLFFYYDVEGEVIYLGTMFPANHVLVHFDHHDYGYLPLAICRRGRCIQGYQRFVPSIKEYIRNQLGED